MKVSLMVLSAGTAAGKMLPITVPQFVIGRDAQCNLRPASAMISKRHCAVLIRNGRVFLRDFDSTNGTYVNDDQLRGEVPVQNGDILKVGPLTFKLVIEGQPVPGKKTPPPPPLKTAQQADEDAAAALLSVDEESGAVDIFEATSDSAVPGGSTVTELPTYLAPDPTAKDDKPKPAEAKKPAPKKPVQGDAQDAAKALFAKMKKGKRK